LQHTHTVNECKISLAKTLIVRHCVAYGKETVRPGHETNLCIKIHCWYWYRTENTMNEYETMKLEH